MPDELETFGLFFVGVAIGTLFPKEYQILGTIICMTIGAAFYFIGQWLNMKGGNNGTRIYKE